LAFFRALQQRVAFAAKEDYQVLDLQFNFWMFLRGENNNSRLLQQRRSSSKHEFSFKVAY
jgi:hypothetical protein